MRGLPDAFARSFAGDSSGRHREARLHAGVVNGAAASHVYLDWRVDRNKHLALLMQEGVRCAFVHRHDRPLRARRRCVASQRADPDLNVLHRTRARDRAAATLFGGDADRPPGRSESPRDTGHCKC